MADATAELPIAAFRAPIVERLRAERVLIVLGETGSGKTFTMEGFEYLPAANGKAPQVDIAGTPRSRLGIVPRAVRKLFAAVEAENSKGGSRMRVMCSYVQIYKEQVWQRWPVRLSLETKGLLFPAAVAHLWRPRLFGSQHEQ